MSPPCAAGCQCRRHTRPRPKCAPGCECKRHARTAESIARQRQSQRGKPHSIEHNAAVAAALTGRRLSPEHIAHITRHGLSNTATYARHKNMMARCYEPRTPAFKHYGARGITVHPSWHDLRTFSEWIDAHLGPCPPGHSLDRIDNNRGYEPGNVRWADQTQQVANRRQHTPKQLTCVVCSERFTAGRVDAKYCSSRCSAAAARSRARSK